MIKSQEFCWLLHFSNFFTTTKSQKISTTTMFCETDILAREVLQTSISALPCVMGSIFFVIRTQRGSTIFALCDTSPARRRFFSFFQHLPNENQKNQQNPTSKLWFRRVGAEVAKSKSAANCHIAPSSTIGTRFSNRQKNDKSIQ